MFLIKLYKNFKNFKWRGGFGFRIRADVVISYLYSYLTFARIYIRSTQILSVKVEMNLDWCSFLALSTFNYYFLLPNTLTQFICPVWRWMDGEGWWSLWRVEEDKKNMKMRMRGTARIKLNGSLDLSLHINTGS